MLKDNLDFLSKYDIEISKFLNLELKRQRENLELIASENIVSEAVMAVMGSHLTNKYAEGYPGKRYYGGCEHVDEIEKIAIDRATKLFNCDYANVQPHSGAQANMAVLFAICKPGDTILSMSLENGGHLSHGSGANMSGAYYNIVSYGVDIKTGYIDYDEVRRLAIECKPKVIIAGASAYARIIDFKRFREIADEVGAVLMADIAHIAGLVVTGLHPSPFPYAHVVTTTTHKTLRGPRGGMILAMEKEEDKFNFNKAIFPGIQGGPLEHVIAAKAICFKEAMSSEFKTYQENVVINAKALGEALVNKGFKLVSGGTDNHLVLLDLTNFEDLTGKEFQTRCDSVHITLNKNTIPGEPRSPFIASGARIGTPAITSRGFVKEEMEKIADLLYKCATDFDNNKNDIVAKVLEMCDKHPVY